LRRYKSELYDDDDYDKISTPVIIYVSSYKHVREYSTEENT